MLTAAFFIIGIAVLLGCLLAVLYLRTEGAAAPWFLALLAAKGRRSRPSAVETFRRHWRAAGIDGKVLHASEFGLLSGLREIVAVAPRREPIGAHGHARLIIVDYQLDGA